MPDVITRNVTAIEILACMACGALILASYKRKVFLVVAILIPSLAIPVRLFDHPASALNPHSGIGSATPTVVTSLFALVLVLAVIGWSRQQFIHATVGLGLLATLAIILVIAWGATPVHWSGYLTWVTALIAWLSGLAIGRRSAIDDKTRRLLAWVLLAVISAELALSLLQVANYGPFAVAASDQGLSRARGTFGHAGDVGKWLVAMVAMLLPNLARRSSREIDLLTYGAILASFLCIGLSASRSNLVAIFTLILAWTLFAVDRRGRDSGRKLLVGGAVAFLPFVGIYLLRFQADPDGGSRPQLLAAALEQLRRTPWWGTGLNSYVEVVGRYDAATAQGLPVHNAFLLLAAEVGIPLFLMALGLVGILTLRIVRIHHVDGANPHTGAYLALMCALVVISFTGWGALKITVLPAIAFSVAFLVGAIYADRGHRPSARDVIHKRHANLAPAQRA